MRKVLSFILSLLIECERFTKIRVDKQLHFICSFIPTVMVGIFNPILGVAFSLGLGIGKETGDAMSANNNWDWNDINANLVGIGCGLIVIKILL